jgi:hypothetical protein
MSRGVLTIALAVVTGLGVGLTGDVESASPTLAPVPESSPAIQDNGGPEYNGQFTYVRIQHGGGLRDMGSSFNRRGRGYGREPPWAHDYPRAETNFAKILNVATYLDTYMEGNSGRILTLDDPELFKYPMATIIEVGRWSPSDAEVLGLRNYLLKGGFLVVDDTRDEGSGNFRNLVNQMNRVLPGYQILQVPNDHDVFNSFFFIEDPLALLPPYGRYMPTYLGVFEDNDPEAGRLMVVINWNQDLQEYWEFSDRGYYPLDLSQEAYQFGVNYVIYANTH